MHTDKKTLALAPHPRLYIEPAAIARLKEEPRLPWLRDFAQRVKADANRFLRTPLDYPRGTHNEHLLRAREAQTRIVTLLVRWEQTGREEFRAKVLDYVRQMAEWEHWSWIAWRAGHNERDFEFDLSYGENSATLAVAYDWLHAGLSPEERRLFLDAARAWSFSSGRKHARKGGAWWFGSPSINWNTVCAGGLGMLCLAMYDDAPEARELMPRCEESIVPYMKFLDTTSGGWPEGIGYWDYGMRYGFMYLLSWENATGRRHPLLRRRATRQTLAFPLEFFPHAVPCSFGDVNVWWPMPFHHVAAGRLGCEDVCHALDLIMEKYGDDPLGDREHWPNRAEWVLLHPGTPGKRPTTQRGGVKIYRGIGWAWIADSMPEPRVYAAVRGGTTKVNHGHLDLLSFHCVIGGEAFVTEIPVDEYTDATFSPRRYEIAENNAAAKNTILINGVGIPQGVALDKTEAVLLPGAEGVRMVASSAFAGPGQGAEFVARLILLLKKRALLVLDRVVLADPGRVESRMHTFTRVQTGTAGATLTGKHGSVRAACACTVPAVFCTAAAPPSRPSCPAPTMLRWVTAEPTHTDVILATLLSPGKTPARVLIEAEGNRIFVRSTGQMGSVVLRLTDRLRPR